MLFVFLACFCLSRHIAAAFQYYADNRTCTLEPLGVGEDDTNQVCGQGPVRGEAADAHPQIEAAITLCGHYGTTVFAPGEYNITR